MLVDTHCHIHDDRYLGERHLILANARSAGLTTMVDIGCDLPTSSHALAIAMAHSDVFCTVGIHPHEAAKVPADFLQQLKTMAQNPKCAGIGECGLDYFYEHSPKDTQVSAFKDQIRLAKELKKALIIHVRDAWDECVEILKEEQAQSIPVIIHCFTGKWQHAKQFLDFGAFLSISGIVTFKDPGELPEVVKNMPLDRLLIETDAPYLAPMPFRGKRNEPAHVTLVAQKIAEILEVSPELVKEKTAQNAVRAFGLN